MIVVTGAAGFISSCLVGKLNQLRNKNIVVVDDFSIKEKEKNLKGKSLLAKVPRKEFNHWMNDYGKEVEFIFHLGARTDTAEFNLEILNELNLEYSKMIWNNSVKYNIPLVYASSAATYGLGEFGYSDNHEFSEKLKPLNPYGKSKNDFDKWVLNQKTKPSFWAGLKFFNVYGPNEYHKGRMASVIFHAFNQIKNTNSMKLFASHNAKYKDGEQLRDFIYVKDVVNVCMFLYKKKPNSGIYNLGTGKARSFLDLTEFTFKALKKEPKISFIPTPKDIRDKYQYFTEADMNKLITAGYNDGFHSLEEGIHDYVTNYLVHKKYL